jgi:5-methyltetrahydropteroyltriglutamate--homocysteine methyltransferase
VLGYPRIGQDRALKRAVEAYWAGTIDESTWRETARRLRADTWTELRDAGLDSVPDNTFSFHRRVRNTRGRSGVEA